MRSSKESSSFVNLGIVLNEKEEVLVIKRKVLERGKDGSVLQWAFPGGKQRYQETREECVEREVLAETGYAVKVEKQISLRVHPQFPVIIAYHLCSLKSSQPLSEPKEPQEVAEIRWVKPEKLPELFTTDLDPLVKKELRIK